VDETNIYELSASHRAMVLYRSWRACRQCLMLSAAVRKVDASANARRPDENEKGGSNAHGNITTHPLPRHGSSQVSPRALKAKGLLIEIIRSLHQELQSLAPLQQIRYILHHIFLYLINLILDGSNTIDTTLGFSGVVIFHSLTENLAEFFIVQEGNGRQWVGTSVLRKEAIASLGQKGIGQTMLVEGVGHAQIAYTVFDNVVKLIIVVLIGHATVVRGDFGQEHPSDRGEIARGCSNMKVKRKRIVRDYKRIFLLTLTISCPIECFFRFYNQ
jgi:hypothetical protein